MDELTPEEVKQIVDEIETWYRETALLPKVRVRYLRFFYDLPTEAYESVLENGSTELFFRNEQGKLEPAGRYIYEVPKKEI
jgi:hypothetical protein